MKSIFDKNFKYVPADQTDVSLTFQRIRAEQAKEKLTWTGPIGINSNSLKKKDLQRP